MKANVSSFFWGLVLIITGGFVLANQMGYLADFSTTTWMLIFAASSALFFVAYFLNGLQAWGWLFPACIFAGLTGTMLAVNSIALNNWIPTMVVGSIAIPFIVAFLFDRSRWWALIPAFILGFVAFIPPLEGYFGDKVMGAFIVAMIGLPFIVIYFITPKAWWGIIPGGVMLSIALMISLENIINSDVTVALMFLGWMLTFGLVWKRQAMDWAKYPAIGLGTLACIMFLVAAGLETFWSLGLIVAGVVMIFFSLRSRQAPLVK